MITDTANNKSFTAMAAQVFEDTAEMILKKQTEIATNFYSQRSGDLLRNLNSRPYTVNHSTSGAELTISYIAKIRFLDISTNKFGTPKTKYEPIYNKVIWGYFYRYAFKMLRHKFTSNLREGTTAQLQAAFTNPIYLWFKKI